eukprot:353547-Chlamydomonas_euryale.AAC.12
MGDKPNAEGLSVPLKPPYGVPSLGKPLKSASAMLFALDSALVAAAALARQSVWMADARRCISALEKQTDWPRMEIHADALQQAKLQGNAQPLTPHAQNASTCKANKSSLVWHAPAKGSTAACRRRPPGNDPAPRAQASRDPPAGKHEVACGTGAEAHHLKARKRWPKLETIAERAGPASMQGKQRRAYINAWPPGAAKARHGFTHHSLMARLDAPHALQRRLVRLLGQVLQRALRLLVQDLNLAGQEVADLHAAHASVQAAMWQSVHQAGARERGAHRDRRGHPWRDHEQRTVVQQRCQSRHWKMDLASAQIAA